MPESPLEANTVTPAASSDFRIGSSAVMLAGSVALSHRPQDEDSATMCGSAILARAVPSTSSSTWANTSLNPASEFGAK